MVLLILFIICFSNISFFLVGRNFSKRCRARGWGKLRRSVKRPRFIVCIGANAGVFALSIEKINDVYV